MVNSKCDLTEKNFLGVKNFNNVKIVKFVNAIIIEYLKKNKNNSLD